MHYALLARKEFFGYLFYNRENDSLYTYKTNKDLNFTNGIELINNRKTEFFDVNEIKLLKTKISRNDILSSPTSVDLYPTLVCNERCEFCYIGNRLNGFTKGLNRDHALRIISELVENGIFCVSILGGEPFLYKDLSWLLDVLYKADLEISISSNGTIYNENIIRKIRDYQVSFTLSMHSHLPKINQSIVKNSTALNKELITLDKALNIGAYVHITTLVTRSNYGTILETIKFLLNKGVKAITLFHWSNSDFGSINKSKSVDFWEFKEVFKKALIIGKEHNAKITSRTNFPFLIYDDMDLNFERDLSNLLYGTIDTRRILHIFYNGDTYSTTYSLSDNKAYLGNIFQDNLNNLWNKNKNLDDLRNAQLPKECKECKHFDYCRGGSVLNYRYTSNNEPPLCPLHIKPLFAE